MLHLNCLYPFLILRDRYEALFIVSSVLGIPGAASQPSLDCSQKGKKIEAIARKPLMSKFRNELCEGKVYRIWYFSVLSNSGNFMASDHEYKLIFNERTKVVLEEAPGIPLNVYSFKNTDEILATGGDYDYLIDVIGLVTNVSREKQYAKAGKVTRMIELELTDDKGKINCALFGNYVDVVKHYVATDGLRMPVLILQFAKIKTFKGDVVIQNVMNATILLWNPDTPEAVCFRDGLALHGIDADMPLAEIDDDDDEVRVITLEEEFLKLYPRKNISELNDTTEDGIFIVMAKICGLVEGDKWWYSACSCHKAVTVEDGLFHCVGCSKFVLSVTPRFRIKLEVGDGSGCGVFVVFDTDCQQLQNKTCKELTMASKLNGKSSNEYPNEIKSIIGRQMLFKVQKSSNHDSTFDDSYRVKKICTDINVVETFKDNSKVQTPTKMISSPKFPIVSAGGPSNSGDDRIRGKPIVTKVYQRRQNK
ncbi:uncharacterized protein LOC130733903 isoform X2 [Lotus japonicus]|uniref:uncharacterized protein LOC130733903 isoform X2 n=1 Tax=Lotus japonicus TaxID=34305 RepID=UPI002583FFE4|nr:uncharacterized protein LOC130733903 isoform X2 [Lotus japonicus]